MRPWSILLFLICGCPAFAQQVNPIWQPFIDKESDPKQRSFRIASMARNESKKVTEDDLRTIAAALSDPAPFVRMEAFFALQSHKGPAAFHAIVADLPYGDFSESAQLLSEYKEAKYVRQMIALLQHSNEHVRHAAIDGIGLTMSPRAFWPLIEATTSLEASLRWRVSLAVMRFRDEPHRKALIKLLRHREPRYRDVAADAMGFMEEGRGVEGLIKLLDDPDTEVSWSAQVALGRFEKHGVWDRTFKEFKGSDPIHRSRAARVLGFQKATPYIAQLFDAMLNDPDEPLVRQACFHALIDIGGPAVPKFLELIKAPVARDRGTAVIALGRIAVPVGRDPLINALSDTDVVVRRLSAEALGSFFGKDVVAALEKAASDPDPGVQAAARASLVKVRRG